MRLRGGGAIATDNGLSEKSLPGPLHRHSYAVKQATKLWKMFISQDAEKEFPTASVLKKCSYGSHGLESRGSLSEV